MDNASSSTTTHDTQTIGAGYSGTVWQDGPTWAWRVTDDRTHLDIRAGAGAGSVDAAWSAAVSAVMVAWSDRSRGQIKPLVGSQADPSDAPDTWERPVDYAPDQQPWMVGPVYSKLGKIAQAAYGVKGIIAVLHEHTMQLGERGRGRPLSEGTVGGLFAAAAALAAIVDDTVADLGDVAMPTGRPSA